MSKNNKRGKPSKPKTEFDFQIQIDSVTDPKPDHKIKLDSPIQNESFNSHNNKNKTHLPFKNKNFIPKFRLKEKHNRGSKNIKNMTNDINDNLSFNICNYNYLISDQSLEAGPSILPKRKYCDITGFESRYIDPISGLRYYNSDIYKILQRLSEPIKNQYLAMRKALFIIK